MKEDVTYPTEMVIRCPDWKLLREQKDTLLKINFNEKDYPNLTKKDINHIEGIIEFIDYIQDTAVDECGLPENKVFRKNKE